MSAKKADQANQPMSNVTQSQITDPDHQVDEVGIQQEAAQEAIIAQSQDERQGLHGQDTDRRVTRD